MPLVLIGADERIRTVNSQAVALFGPALAGRHYLTVLRHPDVLDCVAGTLQHGTAGQTRLEAADHAQESIYRVIAAPADDGTGGQGALVSFEDVTMLEAAGQMRRDFVANVSHELRTPLTALLGFIETLRGAAKDDPAARERFLQTMASEAERMNRLVRDLLSLSRVENEERVRPTERVELSAILDSVHRMLQPLAEAAGMQMRVTAPQAGSVWVLGDADQLVQVFTNLAGNAVKYAASGGRLDFVLRLVERDPVLRTAAVQIDVRDFGPGIDPMHLHRLTERFYRVDSHRSRELGGTGLGLAIVKHIVARHRGRFKVVSEPGAGSVFSVILPRPPG